MSLAWGPRLILILAPAIVIANYQQHRDNFDSRHQLMNNSLRASQNTSHLQDESASQLSPLRIPRLRHHRVTDWDPYFENEEGHGINGTQYVAVHLGATALLDCRVAMLSGKMVLWIRRTADRAPILTLGKTTYISDTRYSVNFQYPNNWRLSISGIQKEDHGVYVCQVNTHPPRMLITNVTVLAPDIRIVDEANYELRDRYYKTGSEIKLECIVRPSRPDSKVPHPLWKKNGEVLPDHVNVYHINGSDDQLVTRFRIEHAKKTDSGEYICHVGQFSTTKVNIHILNGEKQAAVHHDQWNGVETNEGYNKLHAALTALIILRSSTAYFT